MKKFIFLPLFLLLCCTSFGQIKVACVGNSITNGTSTMYGNMDQYPNILDSLMGDDWEVKNFGHSGATLLKKGNYPYWERPEYQAALDFQPDVVLIKLGTNDSKPFNWEVYKSEFAIDYIDLVQTFQGLVSKPKVYLILPTPVLKNPSHIRPHVTNVEIHSLILQVARICNVDLINFFKVLDGKDEFLPDGIHPNVAGKMLMALEAQRFLNEHYKK